MKLSNICAIIVGGVLTIGASASLVTDITVTHEVIAIGVDLIVLLFGSMTVWSGVSSYMYDHIYKQKMEEQWAYQIRPIIQLLEDNAGRIAHLEQNVTDTNLKVTQMMSRDIDASQTHILPGISFKFLSKAMMLTAITTAAIILAVENPLGIVHYIITLFYVAWWLLITIEYKLFFKSTPWLWVAIPLVFVPSLGLILSNSIGLTNMMGLLFLLLFIYAYVYYEWALHTTTGHRLLDIIYLRRLVK